jgi:hypothetical protein
MKGRAIVAAMATLLVVGAGLALPAAAAGTGPTNLGAAWVRGSVKLTWTTGAEPKDFVERSTQPTTGFAQIGKPAGVRKPGQAKNVKDSKVTPGVTYYYRIRGVVDGRDVFSNTVEFTVPGGQAPRESDSPFEWTQFGAAGVDAAKGAGIDDAGNVTFGWSIGTKLNFGDGDRGITNIVSSVAVSYDPNGVLRWSSPVPNGIGAIAVAPNGSVYAASSGPLAVAARNATSPSGAPNLYVAQYSANNGTIATDNVQWATAPGSWATPQAMAIAPSGGIVVTGIAQGSFNFGCGNTDGARGAFVVKYKADLSCEWAKRYTPTGSGALAAGNSVAVDGNGNVAVAGHFIGSSNFGSGTAITSKGEDIFLLSLSPAGATNWRSTYGGAAYDRGTAVAIDSQNSIYLAGNFVGTMTVGGTASKENKQQDIFLAKLTAGGTLQRWQNFPAVETDGNGATPLDLAVDRNGNVAMTGVVLNAVDFGSGTALGGGHENDMFVARFDANGGHVSSMRSGDGYDDRGSAVVFTPAGGMIATGQFFAGVGNENDATDGLHSTVGPDIFVVEIPA